MLTLAISNFDADPQRVTEILGIEPTSVVRKGELRSSAATSRFNGWWLEAHEQPLVDGGEHAVGLGRILEKLAGREAAFAKLRAELQPRQVTIYGGLYVPDNGQCGVWLDPAEMKLLAECGVGWSLDLFTA